MRNFFVLLSLITFSFSALADGASFYRNYPSNKLPKGTVAKFLIELNIPEEALNVTVPLKTRQDCAFYIEPSLKQDAIQILPADTTKEIVEFASWGFRLSAKPNIYVYCQGKVFNTLGEIVDAFSGVIGFEFPEPPKPMIFKFPN